MAVKYGEKVTVGIYAAAYYGINIKGHEAVGCSAILPREETVQVQDAFQRLYPQE